MEKSNNSGRRRWHLSILIYSLPWAFMLSTLSVAKGHISGRFVMNAAFEAENMSFSVYVIRAGVALIIFAVYRSHLRNVLRSCLYLMSSINIFWWPT